MDSISACYLRQPVTRGTGNIHRSLEVDPELLAAFGSAHSDSGAEIKSFRIPANECFRKHDKLGSGRRRVAREIGGLVESPVAIEQDRPRLDNRSVDGSQDQ